MKDITIDAKLNASHASGKAVAMEVFAAKLRGWAGDAFSANRDEAAKWYRDLAERAASDAKVYRAEQKRHEEGDGA